MLLEVFFAGVAAAAFGILFNVRGSNLVWAALNGALGFLLYRVSVSQGFASYMGMFFASMAMALFAEICARLRKTPVSIFLAPALIPIVPGGGMFRCALNLLEGNIQLAVADGITTTLEATAIAVGIIVLSSLTKVYLRARQRGRAGRA